MLKYGYECLLFESDCSLYYFPVKHMDRKTRRRTTDKLNKWTFLIIPGPSDLYPEERLDRKAFRAHPGCAGLGQLRSARHS